jgi:hypothetical protein
MGIVQMMALDGMNFHRDKIDDATLNADIWFTVFLKPDGLMRHSSID